MNTPLSDDPTTRVLAAAMQAEVEGVAPPTTLVSGLRARADRRRQTRLAAVGGAACAAVVAAFAVTATRPAAAPPAGLPLTTTPLATAAPEPEPEPEPVILPPPRMEAATLPRGFRYWNTEHAKTNPHYSDRWPLAVVYARGFTDAGQPRTPILVTTAAESLRELDPEHFTATDSNARWVVVGSRRVVRAVGSDGTVGYHWTERRGVNVSVTARAGVTSAELRQVLTALRLVTPAPPRSDLPRLEASQGTGVLLRETRGRGSRTLGPIAVPAAFDVHLECRGKTVRVEIGTLRDSTLGCAGETPMRHLVDHTNGVRSVTLTLTADSATRWAVLVTTSEGRP